MTGAGGSVHAARRALTIVLIAFVLLVAGTALAVQLAPALGHRLFAIRSGSMQPQLAVGDLAVVRETDTAAVGEILTFRLPNGVVVTHRVTEVTTDESGTTYHTKGDANPTADAAGVPATWSIGVVGGRIPLLGFLVALIAMPIGIVTVLSIGCSLITAIWLLDEYAAQPNESPVHPPWPADPQGNPTR